MGMIISAVELSTLSTSESRVRLGNWSSYSAALSATAHVSPLEHAHRLQQDHKLNLKIRMSCVPNHERYLALDDVVVKPRHLSEIWPSI